MSRPVRAAGRTILPHLIVTDIRCGARPTAARVALVFAIANMLCFMLFTVVAPGRTNVETLTFADYLSACVGGISTYSARTGDSFKLPAGWLCLCAAIAYTVLDYPTRDLKGMGSQVLAASGSRRRWWLSKCVWVACTAFIAWATVLLACAVWALCAGDGLGAGTLDITPGVPALLGFDALRLNAGDVSVAGFLVCAPFVIAALCVAQLAIGIASAPLVGFASLVSVLLLSAVYTSPVLPGNYLMVARSEATATDGVSWALGLALALAIAVVAAILGNLAYAHHDIRGREADAS